MARASHPARRAYPEAVRLEVWLPVLGAVLYGVNVLLGVGLQLHWWTLGRAKWVHHALYFAVFVVAGLSTLALLLAVGRWWGLLPTLLCLSYLPRAKGGTRLHMTLTLLGVLGYVVVLI
jgi:hypothetical protein